MKQDAIKTTILVGLICAIVFLLYKRRRDTPVKMTDKIMKELYSIKDALIPKKYIEKYRSSNNNGLTIVGTIMEQAVDIMIAILKQDTTKEMIESLVRNPADAITIAEAIETVGAQIVSEIGKNAVLRKETVNTSSIDENSNEVAGTSREVYRPDNNSMTNISENGMRAGVLNVLGDTSKYDKYYEATKNILLDVERKTNPDVTDERFPTKEVFKSEIMPELMRVISTVSIGGRSPSEPSSKPMQSAPPTAGPG